jgi:hypothetical protein
MRLMRALMEDPKPEEIIGTIGSPIHTLQRRLSGLGQDYIIDLVGQLRNMGITKLERLHTNMTAEGAADLRETVTMYGQRLTQYILDAQE